MQATGSSREIRLSIRGRKGRASQARLAGHQSNKSLESTRKCAGRKCSKTLLDDNIEAGNVSALLTHCYLISEVREAL
jgi:hypothetical protein